MSCGYDPKTKSISMHMPIGMAILDDMWRKGEVVKAQYEDGGISFISEERFQADIKAGLKLTRLTVEDEETKV